MKQEGYSEQKMVSFCNQIAKIFREYKNESFFLEVLGKKISELKDECQSEEEEHDLDDIVSEEIRMCWIKTKVEK